MKYLGAYLLATLGGNASPSAQDILKIIGSVGQDVDMDEANKVVEALKGKKVADLIADGKKKLSSVPSGGSAAPAAAPKGGAPTPAAAKESKKEEPKEESDDDMGFGLFD